MQLYRERVPVEVPEETEMLSEWMSIAVRPDCD